jgi:hypothetical protein
VKRPSTPPVVNITLDVDERGSNKFLTIEYGTDLKLATKRRRGAQTDKVRNTIEFSKNIHNFDNVQFRSNLLQPRK